MTIQRPPKAMVPEGGTFSAPADRLWTVTLAVLRQLGWDIDKADRDIGWITTDSRKVDGEGVLLQSGETVLGLTVERITLAPSLCGWLEGRSRFARLGLAVHVTAGFLQPGIDNRQVLEMTNLGPTPLMLRPGVRVCQLVVERCEGEAVYQGRFAVQ